MGQTAFNWIFAILIIGAIILAALAYFKPAVIFPPEPDGSPSKKGLGEALAAIIAQASKSDWVKNIFSSKSDYEKNNCDPNKTGYNNNGKLDPSCGGGSGSCNPFECDPNNLGNNMCGDSGFPCTCGSETPQTLC